MNLHQNWFLVTSETLHNNLPQSTLKVCKYDSSVGRYLLQVRLSINIIIQLSTGSTGYTIKLKFVLKFIKLLNELSLP